MLLQMHIECGNVYCMRENVDLKKNQNKKISQFCMYIHSIKHNVLVGYGCDDMIDSTVCCAIDSISAIPIITVMFQSGTLPRKV